MIAPFDLSGEASAALSVLALALLVRQPGSTASFRLASALSNLRQTCTLLSVRLPNLGSEGQR